MSTVLILTSEEDRTAELVEKELHEMETPFLRLNTEKFGNEFQIDFIVKDSTPEILIRTCNKEIVGEEVRSIWYRRPLPPQPSEQIDEEGARQFAAEELKSSLDGALFALDCTWVSHPSAIRTATYKPYQIKAACRYGFTVPKTLISMDPVRVKKFYNELREVGKKTAAKLVSQGPPRASTPDEQYSIFTTLLEDIDIARESTLSYCPAIYQEYIEKKYELRVTVVGDKTYACEIHSQETETTRIDWRRYDLPNTPHLPHKLDPAVENKCISLTKHFGLLFSAIDLVVSPDGQVMFLELNPNGQWGWIQELTGLPIAQALANLLSGR